MVKLCSGPIDARFAAKFSVGILLVVLIVSLAADRSSAATAKNPAAIRQAKEYVALGKFTEAMQLYERAADDEPDLAERALIHFSLGLELYGARQFTDAEASFNTALRVGLRIPEYAYFYLADIRREQSRYPEAKAFFTRILDSPAPVEAKRDARFAIAGLTFAEKQWRTAAAEYSQLQRQSRFDARIGEILYQRLRAEVHFASHAAVCKTARELYSKHPQEAVLSDWGADLTFVIVEEKKLGCQVSLADFKSRIRRLELAGQSERAQKEIEEMRGKSSGAISNELDAVMANHFINEGNIDEALKILMQHPERRSVVSYLMLLGKALSRNNDYAAAAAVFHQAYQNSPQGKDASFALFQSAFARYQMQDYDGAQMEFQFYLQRFSGGRMAREARWYTAWISYLRGDDHAAIESFAKMSKTSRVWRRAGRRRVLIIDDFNADRARYWTAMSLLRQGRVSEANERFAQLAHDPAIGYYAILAQLRLAGGAVLTPSMPLTEEEMAQAQAVVAAQVASEIQPELPVADEEPVDTNRGDAVNESSGEMVNDAASSPQFKTPGLEQRFTRAGDLAQVGLDEAARQELAEIERHVSKPAERRLLMEEYAKFKNFYRASYIGELGFSAERLRGGMSGEGRIYWEHAYPRAWQTAVTETGRSIRLQPELIWSIIRTESHFRPEARSAVGALGLMQLMPFTARKLADETRLRGFATSQLLQPEVNVRLGARYLKRLLDKFSGSMPLMAASYNAGPHRVHAWVKNFGGLSMDEFIEHIPFMETRNYVKKFARTYHIYQLLYASDTKSAKWLIEPVGIELSEPAPTREIW